MKLDRTDRRILSSCSAMTGSATSNWPTGGSLPTPCSRRVKRLEESGITGHVALLNQNMLGLKLTAFIGISMDRHTPDRFEAFEAEVRVPEVMECSVVTGQAGLPAEGGGARYGVLREIPAGPAHPDPGVPGSTPV